MTALALACAHVAVGLLVFAPQPHTGGDNAAYIALGRSLLETGTYTEIWDPLTPPHTKYPPVFPGVLAAAMRAGLEPWVQLKFVVLAFSAAATALAFLWVHARRRPLLALGIGSVIALAPGVASEARWVLSDVPFWTFTMAALWAFERLRPHQRVRFAVAALATLLAFFTRSAGLPLAVAAIAMLVLRRQWKHLGALALLIGVPACAWWLRARAFGPSGYVSEFWLLDPYAPHLGRAGPADLAGRVITNVSKYVSIHLPLLLAGRTGSVLTLTSAFTFALAVGGWIMRMRSPRVAEVFVLLYLGLILLWPDVWSGERFLLPVLPLLLFYAGESIVRLLRRTAPRFDFMVPAAAAAVLILVGLPGTAQAHRLSRDCVARYRLGEPYPCLGSPAWTDLFQLAEAAGSALPAGAIVINRKPRLFYALGGVRGSIYPFTPEPDAFFATVDSIGARYVVLDRLGSGDAFLVPVLLRRPAAFCLMHARPGGTVLLGISQQHRAVPDLGESGLRNAAAVRFAICDTSFWRDAAGRSTLGPE